MPEGFTITSVVSMSFGLDRGHRPNAHIGERFTHICRGFAYAGLDKIFPIDFKGTKNLPNGEIFQS